MAGKNDIQTFIENKKVLEVIRKLKSQELHSNDRMKYNLFTLFSDFYYRENFHSDIVRLLLEVPQILHEFLVVLNAIKPELKLNTLDYSAVEVERETGRIDVLLVDRNSRKAIIIENKINEASDQDRQLPRYLEYINEKKYLIEGVIYLTLDGRKRISKHNWTDKDKEFVDEKFINLAAFDKTDSNLYKTLAKSESKINDIDILNVIRQYKQLLKSLSKKTMIMTLNEEFYNLIKESNNLETVKEINRLYTQLPELRARLLQEKYSNLHKPFDKVDIWKEVIVYFDELNIEKSNFAIDIHCKDENYRVEFFDRSALEENSSTSMELMKKIDFNLFKIEENKRRIYCVFQFPSEENELWEFINELLQKLQDFIEISKV